MGKDNGVVRYLVQFLIPALLFLSVIYAVTRRRRNSGAASESGADVYLTILVVGAVVAVATLFVLQVNWSNL